MRDLEKVVASKCKFKKQKKNDSSFLMGFFKLNQSGKMKRIILIILLYYYLH